MDKEEIRRLGSVSGAGVVGFAAGKGPRKKAHRETSREGRLNDNRRVHKFHPLSG
jgi:hypothetical protein